VSLHLKTSSVQSGKVIWQGRPETVQGGFTLNATGLPSGSTIPGGTPCRYNEATRMVSILKTASVVESAGASATDIKINTGSIFSIGDYVSKTAGGTAYAITAIVRGANYDTITVGTTLGALTAGDVLFQSSATGATAGAINIVANGLTYQDYTVGLDEDISVAFHGKVYARRIPALPTATKTALHQILFSESF
jgi:hypothetical protein